MSTKEAESSLRRTVVAQHIFYIILQLRSYWFHVADDAMETIMFPKFYFVFDSVPAEVMALG